MATDAGLGGLTDTELHQMHVTHQPFWPILHDIVRQQRWTDLGPETDLTEHLAHYCMICGTWCNRFQELHAHLRLQHSQLVLGGVAKGAQMSQLLDIQSPCLLCSKSYNRVHSCPVTLQVGILAIQSAGTQALAKALHCELCERDLPDMSSLYRHLCLEHDLVLNDWCPARDAMHSSDICAHCGMQFDSRSGLRRHVTEGRCETFNPLATAAPCDVEAVWGPTLLQGKVMKAELTAMQRMKLTTVCQLCDGRYDRQGDLVAHLLQSHGSTWQNSQAMLRFLLQVTSTQNSCICNPMVNVFSPSHVCAAYRQLAMIYSLSTVDILTPTQFHVPALQQHLMGIHDDGRTTKLIQVLCNREFSQLWTEPDLLDLLRTRCLYCGGHYRPATLLAHLLSQHAEECRWAAQIIFQLTNHMRHTQLNDFQCQCCTLVFNLPSTTDMLAPARVDLQEAHFDSNCPVARQIAALLLPHGRPVPGSTRSGTHEQHPGAGTPFDGGQKVAGRKRRCQGPEALQIRRLPRRHRQVSTQPGDPEGDPGDGHVGADARTSPATTAQTKLFHFIHPVRSSRSTTSSHQPVQTMARPSTCPEGPPGMADAANVHVCGTDERTSPSSASVRIEQSWRAVVGDGNQEGHHQPRRQLDLPTMVSGAEAAGDSLQGSHPDGPHGEAHGTSGGAPTGQLTCHPLPQPSSPGTHCSLEPAGYHEGCGTLESAGEPCPLFSMESPGNVRQAAQSEHVPPSSDVVNPAGPTCEGPQGRGQGQNEGETAEVTGDAHARHSMRQRMLSLAFANRSTLCYANSAIICFLWASMSRVNFQTQDWGALQTAFCDMLGSSFNLINLTQYAWFNQLIQSWNDQHDQADSAEFANRLLTWAQTPVVSNAWERRVTMGLKTVLHDYGTAYMPITLQLDPAMIDHDEIQLTSLLRLWHHDLGMQAGLTCLQDLIVLHIDRVVSSPSGQLRKLTTALRFCWNIQLPLMQPEGICSWEPFQLVAALAHSGTMTGGHYQALLRTFPEVSDHAAPVTWLFCDDNAAPERCFAFPSGFEEGVTGLWLCRTRNLELHRLHPTPEPRSHDMDTNALLATLDAQPNVGV